LAWGTDSYRESPSGWKKRDHYIRMSHRASEVNRRTCTNVLIQG